VLKIDRLVHRLPESDHVIALDQEGRVAEQGSFPNLRINAGYVESLDITSHFREEEEEEGEPSSSSGSDIEPKETVLRTRTIEEEQAVSSDTSVFLYYFKAIRAYNIALLVGFVVASAVIAALRCEFLPRK
jgi:ATP-binding cassette subfamily C (CFTR/MRP) protein 1